MNYYEPTPAEIRAVCLEIQSEWTPAEERKRRAIPHEPARCQGTGRGLSVRRRSDPRFDERVSTSIGTD